MATDLEIAVRKVVSTNPATGERLREIDCASPTQVQRVVSRAGEAQPAWAALGLKKRTAILGQFQHLLLEKKVEIATLITREAGKPYVEALLTEVLVVLDATRFLIENAHGFLRPERVPHGGLAMKAKTGRLLREPHGVIGIVSPWNYPFSIPAVEALAALVTGNAVVLKPSEFTSLVGLELASLLHASGVPQAVFQVVVGDGAAGAALLDSPIDKLVFTGSVATGKRVAQAAATRLLPVLLELGGKDPMLVLDDADLEVASSAAVWGAFLNAGQTCLSVERCYVHRSLYEPFLETCVEKTGKLRVGHGLDPETEIGPMIHDRQLRVVEEQVNEAKALGARVLAGGSPLPELGPHFYAPTVLADVPVVVGDGTNGTVEGATYREFLLDLNEPNGNTKPYISLDALQIWQEESGNLTGFTPGSGFAGGHTNYLAYNLDAGGNHWIALTDGLSHGSGQSDYRILIPDSYFINDAEPMPDYPASVWLDEHSAAWVVFRYRLDSLFRQFGEAPDWKHYYRALYDPNADGWKRTKTALAGFAGGPLGPRSLLGGIPASRRSLMVRGPPGSRS